MILVPCGIKKLSTTEELCSIPNDLKDEIDSHHELSRKKSLRWIAGVTSNAYLIYLTSYIDNSKLMNYKNRGRLVFAS